MTFNRVAFTIPSSLLFSPLVPSTYSDTSPKRYHFTRLAGRCHWNLFTSSSRRRRYTYYSPRCAAASDPDGGNSDDSASQLPQNEDWRAFRARLVQNENIASTHSSTSAPPSDSQSSGFPSTTSSKSTSGPHLWAHHIPFVEAGSLLLASPEHFCDEYACTFFANTAILILDHSNLGSLGVIVNRPISVQLNTSLKLDSLTDRSSIEVPGIYRQPQAHSQHVENPESSTSADSSEHFASESDLAILNEAPVFNGGPVRLETLILLHGDPEFGDPITGAIRTAPFHSAVARYREGALPDARFFVGYTGWASGQLEQEIKEGVWYTCACCDELLLKHWTAGIDLHRVVLPLMGGHYAEIAETLRDDQSE